MSNNYIYKNDFVPVEEPDINKWAMWFQTADRHVQKTVFIYSDILVSTVFLGLNHNWSGGRPVLFETVIFGGDLDQEMERYTCVEDARIGHEVMVEKVRSGLGFPENIFYVNEKK